MRRGAAGASLPPIILPTQKTVPFGDLSDFLILMYGKRKIGKTTLWARLPRAFFLMCDPGGKALELFQPQRPDGKPKHIESWAEFVGYVDALEQADFGPIVVDTADRAYELCFEAMCRKLAITHPHDENDYGKSWGMINGEYMRQLDRLMGIGRGVVLLSHSKIRENKETGKDVLQSTLSGSIGDKITGVVDIWGCYTYVGGGRYWYIRGSETLDAGCRLEKNFQSPAGNPLTRVYMGTDADQAFANLHAAFHNQPLPHPEPAPIVPQRTAPAGVKRTVARRPLR